ncbi:cysteine-rich venom protein-like [Sceloporus undulatus]|uniref:cysteine-rich venom protein-like n=1 Tax=Sceloporus undulatus TaxID=8520 RepID=UPI001C4CB8F0|nr:cysteine-rich venom protein-like [Sceloporus undulatus]
MSPLMALLVLATGLHQSVGNEKDATAFAALSTDLPEVQKEVVHKHNSLRRQVDPSASNMLKMEWNVEAAENAKYWAEHCVYSHSPEYRRTLEDGMLCGENLFYSSVPVSWSEAIQAWFDEREDFVFGEGPTYRNAVIGHYTQLVWYKSYMIACAVSYCDHKIYKYFYVCQYCPAGNVLGIHYYSPYKEGEPCGDCPSKCDDGLCTNPCPYEDEFTNCPKLKEDYSCNHLLIEENCQESCFCESEI